MLQPILIASLLPVPVLGALAVQIYRRKQHRLYPVFWAYSLFEFLAVPAEIICNQLSSIAYFYVFWGTSFARIIFQLLLLRTIFAEVLTNYVPLKKMRGYGYEVVLGSVWIIGVLVSFRAAHNHTIYNLITRGEEAASFAEVGMFCFVVVASLLFGLRWRAVICGIALGLGVSGTVDLLVFKALSSTAITRLHASWIETLTFDLMISIFAVYFLPRRAEPAAPIEIRTDVYEWAHVARKAISQ